MKTTVNKPYVKMYDKNGAVFNPIISIYIHHFPNRSQRRRRPDRFIGNGKNFHITIFKEHRFKRHLQVVLLKDGTLRKIEHYLSV